jgi:hypothetical protein
MQLRYEPEVMKYWAAKRRQSDLHEARSKSQEPSEQPEDSSDRETGKSKNH